MLPEQSASILNGMCTDTRLKVLAGVAQSAISDLWSQQNRSFLRSTVHAERELEEPTKRFFPTVTFKCTAALASVALSEHFADEEATLLLHGEVTDSICKLDPQTIKTSLDSAETDKPNAFTRSQFLYCVCKLLQSLPENDQRGIPLKIIVNSIAKDILSSETAKNIVEGRTSNIHPYFLYHLRRAFVSSLKYLDKVDVEAFSRLTEGIFNGARSSIERSLAREGLGISMPGDAVALAFAAGALSGEKSGSSLVYVSKALALVANAQTPSGYWAFGRVVSTQKDIVDQRLEIPTHEVLAVMAESMEACLEADPSLEMGVDAVAIISAVNRGVEFAERSVSEVFAKDHLYRGWCNDHAYGEEIVESWTSAIVLESIASVFSFLDCVRRKVFLESFSCLWPTSPDWPSWLKWDKYKTEGEVDHDRPVLRFIDQHVVAPIELGNGGKNGIGPGCKSLLLFGPPGTSKTTIVRGIAQALNWPLVTLSPGDFIDNGLELIEAQSVSVFSRLIGLSRAVVIFDECDELFRFRAPSPANEQTRSITAFVTASMLPKMADLHDRGRIIFAVCTNNFGTMDAAIKRSGRIDYIIPVGPPDSDARRLILSSEFDGSNLKSEFLSEETLAECVSRTDRFTRGELVRLVRSLVQDGSGVTKPLTAARVRESVEEMTDGLTVTVQDYEAFKEDRRKYSHVSG